MISDTTSLSTEESVLLLYQKDRFILLVAGIALSFVIFVVNLATIVTFVINRHLLRRSVYCLNNLAVADMVYGVFNMIWYIIYFGQYYGLTYTFLKLATWSLNSISLFSLVVVALDRVYATFFPFRHRTTRLRMYIAVFTITWFLPLPFIIIYQSNIFLRYAATFALIVLLTWLVIICTSYTAIFFQVKSQANRIQPNQQPITALQRRQKREQHLAMTLFIVTVLSLITWLPYIICYKLVLFSSNNSYILVLLLYLGYLLRDTNSLINPIVYVFRMRDFRKALKKLIFKCSRDQQYNHPIGHHGNHDRHQHHQ